MEQKLSKLELRTDAVDLTDLAIGIVVLGITVSIGATILLNIRDTEIDGGTNCTAAGTDDNGCGTAYNLADDAATGIAEYGNWFDIIVIVGVAGLILALIFMAFGNRGRGSGSVAY